MQAIFSKLNWPELGHTAVHYGIRVGIALLILLIGFWLAARVANFGRRAMQRGGIDETLIVFLRNLIYGLLITVVIVTVLQESGVPSASFLTALGAAGLAIGLALQGSLSNLAWGVLLIAFRPFRVGDFVQLGSLMGTVDRIDLMQTHLIMPDNREAIVPNAKVGGDAIINFNRRGRRRFEFNVGIGYGDDIGRAIQVVREVFAADERILKDPAPGVWMNELGDSSVNLLMRGWTNVPDFWETQMAFIRAVKERFDAEGISIPFPQREVKWINGTPAGAVKAESK